MEINIDAVTELNFKTGKALRYNVMFTTEGSYFAIPGYRWMDGCLHPPAVRNKQGWYATAFLGKGLAEGLYCSLKAKLEELGHAEKYPLVSMDVAIEKIVAKSDMCRYFPGSLGK